MKQLRKSLRILLFFILVTFSQIVSTLKVFECSLCDEEASKKSCYVERK